MSSLSPRLGIQVSSVYPTYTHIKGQCPLCVCVCVCVRACVRACVHACMHACVCVCVCVAKPVAVELRCHATALIIFELMRATDLQSQPQYSHFSALLANIDIPAGMIYFIRALSGENLSSGQTSLLSYRRKFEA